MVLSFPEFRKAAARGNLVTLAREIPADLDTPVSALLKLGSENHSFLFESMEGGERWGRYSFLGINPRLILQSRQDEWEIRRRESKSKISESGKGDPLLPLKEEMGRFHLVEDPILPRLCGGAVGYLGYDMVRFFERLPDRNPHELPFPDSYFAIYDHLIIFDNLRHSVFVVVNAFLDGKESNKKVYERAMRDLDQWTRHFQQPLSRGAFQTRPKPGRKNLKWKTSMDEASYAKAVVRAQEYIKAGDVFQVVLSSRWQAQGKVDSFQLYRVLRGLNPSPYLFHLKMGDCVLVGSSPEVMVRLEGRKATLRPIAGTRRRGKDREDDLRLEKEMLADPKERAEHLMLVDLGRNDLGRVSAPGSVKVTELMTVERYSHVMHIVSNVEAELQKGKDAFDLLRASFPAGTLTGAPKIRAMEVIEELEPLRRGPYGGCVGYIDFAGNLDTAITIRSVALTKKELFVQAGAGIVFDSIPKREFMECQNKARAMMEAIKSVVSS
jgi:anthranilate synthase component 1